MDKKTKPASSKAGTANQKPSATDDKKRKKVVEVGMGVPSEQGEKRKARQREKRQVEEAVVEDKKTKPESSKAGTANKKPSATDNKKRKKVVEVETGVPSEQEIAEKIKEIARDIHAPAKKKRKTGETKSVAAMDEDHSPRSTKKKHEPQITQTIKDIAKSATKRARFAQSKAGDGGGGSSSKRKRGKKVD